MQGEDCRGGGGGGGGGEGESGGGVGGGGGFRISRRSQVLLTILLRSSVRALGRGHRCRLLPHVPPLCTVHPRSITCTHTRLLLPT